MQAHAAGLVNYLQREGTKPKVSNLTTPTKLLISSGPKTDAALDA